MPFPNYFSLCDCGTSYCKKPFKLGLFSDLQDIISIYDSMLPSKAQQILLLSCTKAKLKLTDELCGKSFA